MADIPVLPTNAAFTVAEMNALAHLYRGELYRSKIWRMRLDTTTNWAVGTTGLALSIAFSNHENSPLPILVITLLAVIFWGIEARRYRYFDIFRTRVRVMEVSMYGAILRGEGMHTKSGWNAFLAEDYARLQFHITYWEALGRRLRRNYIWIFLVLGVSYFGKLLIHPTPLGRFDEIFERAAVGPIHGGAVLAFAVAAYGMLFALATMTMLDQKAAGRVIGPDNDEESKLLRKRLKI